MQRGKKKKRPLTFLLVILVGVIGAVMKMMGGRMVASYRRHQGVVPQCRMRVMRMMMTEEPDSGGGCLVLSLHRLLYLALNLPEDRMMRWPSCQMKRKHRCRPLEQSGWSEKGTTGTSGAATRRQWEGQTTSWFQDHVWDQLDDWLPPRRRDFTYFASMRRSPSLLGPRRAALYSRRSTWFLQRHVNRQSSSTTVLSNVLHWSPEPRRFRRRAERNLSFTFYVRVGSSLSRGESESENIS